MEIKNNIGEQKNGYAWNKNGKQSGISGRNRVYGGKDLWRRYVFTSVPVRMEVGDSAAVPNSSS